MLSKRDAFSKRKETGDAGTLAQKSLEEEMKQLKEAGGRLVAERRHDLAADQYQHAILVFMRAPSGEDTKPENKRLAAQCYLNLALCLLAPQDSSKASEAIVCCDAALKLLPSSESALRAKALYRKGQAHELRSELKLAVAAMSAAQAASPDDATIRAALERLRIKE